MKRIMIFIGMVVAILILFSACVTMNWSPDPFFIPDELIYDVEPVTVESEDWIITLILIGEKWLTLELPNLQSEFFWLIWTNS